MAVIEDLLNGSSQMYSNTKITTLSIDDLNVNELNNAPIINIEELAHSIKENGLQTPLTCYKRDNHEYVLINGERRYTALKSLEIDDVPVIIIPKPDSILTEQLMIMDSNSQREESQEYRSLRAKEYAEIYLALKAEGRIQTGLLKIDWIGMHMNISGRQVQRL
ncbi:MAG: ParB N-terminal domain-containing protein, partial [Erysipelotrichales bacterium]